MPTKHPSKYSIPLIAILAGLGSPALAQQADHSGSGDNPNGTAPSDQIGDIVVTASKRGDQRLQSVAASIGVLTATALAKRDVVNFADVTRNIGGLNVINEGPGQNTIMIRGLVGAGESTVGLYYDNLATTGTGESAALNGGRQTDFVVFDTERVEVLRGPQSTLYGSSALAGVVRVISRQADPSKVAGRIELEGSTTKRGAPSYSLKAMVNLPVTDQFALRLVGYHVKDGGYIDNVQLGRKDANDAQQTGFRLSSFMGLGDRTTLTGQLYVQRLRSHGGALARPYGGVVGTVAYPAIGKYATDKAAQQFFNDDTLLAGLTLDHDLDFADLTVTQSYQHRKNLSVADSTPLGNLFRFLQTINAFPNVPTPGPLIFRSDQTADLWNSEARVATKLDGPLNGVFGALYQTRKIHIANRFDDVDPRSGLAIAGNAPWFSRAADFKFNQYAVFGELTYKLSDQFSVLGGIRAFKNNRHDISTSIVPFLRLGTPGAPDNVSSKESKVIYKLEADYKPNADMLFYASASQGYRAGGTIVRVIPQLPPSYGPDYTWNFEAGAKTQWFDRRLQANLALYRVNWYNTQVTGEFYNGTFEGVLNCKGRCASSTGVELDLTARPARGVDITASGTVFKAKWEKDQPDINGSPLAGTQFARTPRFTFSLSPSYTWSVDDRHDIELRVDVQHSGRWAYNDYRPQYNLHAPGAYTLVNASAILSQGNRWSAKLFARNLFDERAVFNVIADSTTPYDVLTARPRTIGLQFGLSY